MTDVVVRIANGVADLPRDEWDACAGADNPFVSWDFLAALERSGSVGGATRWANRRRCAALRQEP